jgi:alkanesulfonate monooxygenase SsuD/methylene tetrahydromethanopterin reductase-like flavin-dependent oxidoreductase (luciferase family)
MQIGFALNIPGEDGRCDAAVICDHLALADLAEPVGFDSLFVLEHHFTGYVLSPAPFELLAYFAGRTEHIQLGTAVVVLPWNDPVRVAEQIAVLDIVSSGRCLFGFGWGRALSEFEPFRVPQSEARARFVEASEIIIGLLANEKFEYSGEYYQIPRCSIRPRPASRAHERLYGAAGGQEALDTMARLGLGILTSTQRPWPMLGADAARFRETKRREGQDVSGPIVLAMVSVAQERRHAQECATEYIARDMALTDRHYGIAASLPGSRLGQGVDPSPAQAGSQATGNAQCKLSLKQYMDLQVVGTPDDCIQQIEQLKRDTGVAHLVLEFSYGGMPSAVARDNIVRFAQDVMPRVRSR